jgi:hypothetical protein
MCSQLSGEVWASGASGTASPRARRYGRFRGTLSHRRSQAVAVVAAMKEAPLPKAVRPVVGGVEVPASPFATTRLAAGC